MFRQLLSLTTFLLALQTHAQLLLCRESLQREVRQAIETPLAPQTLYRPIFSTDLTYLIEKARIADSPAPQANMSTAEGRDQFHINNETTAILQMKTKLLRYRDKVIRVQPEQGPFVLAAVREQFTKMLAELPLANPQHYRADGDRLTELTTGQSLSLKELARLRNPQLAVEKLGLLVPEDLVFLKQDSATGEFHLVGGFLAFPTHWSLAAFPGSSIKEIHENVGATPEVSAKFSSMINRILARSLQMPQVAARNNWFLETDPRYALPDYQTTTWAGATEITNENANSNVFLRVERQTIRGLSESQAVVFAIQPLVYPLPAILSNSGLSQTLAKGLVLKYGPLETAPTFIQIVGALLANREP